MVSPEVIDELTRCCAAVERQKVNASQYSGSLLDLVFDVVTAETAIVGIASKLIEGDRMEESDRLIANRPLFTDGRFWQLRDGEAVEILAHNEIWRLASAIEALRTVCDTALQLLDGSKLGGRYQNLEGVHWFWCEDEKLTHQQA